MDDTKMKKGLLIAIEGIDGSGKSSVLDTVVKMLVNNGIDILKLVEPTCDSKWGREIRNRVNIGNLTPEEEMELFINDRKWDIKNNILPALNDGRIVLMDRYFFSNAVYQSFSSDYTWQEILDINRGNYVNAPEPDMVIIFDLDVETAYTRRSNREHSENQLECRERLECVRNTYREMASHDTVGNYTVVDASLSFDNVAENLYKTIIDIISKTDDYRITVSS